MGWGGRWEGGSGSGKHVNPWLIHISVWQKTLQVKKKKEFDMNLTFETDELLWLGLQQEVSGSQITLAHPFPQPLYGISRMNVHNDRSGRSENSCW